MIQLFLDILKQISILTMMLVYPDRCPVCDRVLSSDRAQTGICPECRIRLDYIGDNHCMVCGKRLEKQERELCFDCKRIRHYFSQGRSLYAYRGDICYILYRYKFFNRRDYGRFFAVEIRDNLGGWIYDKGIDIIVPVPMTKKSRRARGYNQSELLARNLSRTLDIPHVPYALAKRHDTFQQKKLNAAGRRKNLRDIFVPCIRLHGECVLLVDDIYTTGATVDMASKALLSAGASRVYVITVASA